MSTKQKVIAQLDGLSPQQQAEVLRLIECFAKAGSQTGHPTSPFGLWSDLKVDISAEDIDHARRDVWAGFPREDIA